MVNRLGICASLRGLANKFKEISEIRIIFLVSLFVGLFGNWTFFSQVFLAYPFSLKLVGFYLSLLNSGRSYRLSHNLGGVKVYDERGSDIHTDSDRVLCLFYGQLSGRDRRDHAGKYL